MAIADYFHAPPELTQAIRVLESGIEQLKQEKLELAHHAEITEQWWSGVDRVRTFVHSVDWVGEPNTSQVLMASVFNRLLTLFISPRCVLLGGCVFNYGINGGRIGCGLGCVASLCRLCGTTCDTARVQQ